MSRWLAAVVCLLLVGCGPAALGAGINKLLKGHPAPDPTSPALEVVALEPGSDTDAADPFFVNFETREGSSQPAASDLPLRFEVTPNKQGVVLSALVRQRVSADPGEDTLDDWSPPLTRDGTTLRHVALLYPDQFRDGEWSFIVTGVDREGRSVVVEREFVVDTVDPTRSPLLVAVEARGPREVHLDWIPSIEAGIVGYRVYFAVDEEAIPGARDVSTLRYDGPGSPIFVPGGTASSFSASGLGPTSTYFVQVVAVDEAGNESALTPAGERAVRVRAGGDGTVGIEGPSSRIPALTRAVGDAPGETFRDLVIADLDGDRRPEFIVGSDRSIRVLRSKADGDPDPPWPSGAGAFQAFAVGDVTADGVPDIVVAGVESESERRLAVLSGAGDGSFVSLGTVGTGQALEDLVRSVRIADLDDDGVPGVVLLRVKNGMNPNPFAGKEVWTDWIRDASTLLVGGSLPTSSLGANEMQSIQWRSNLAEHLVVADVDGDRTKDLVACTLESLHVARGRLEPPADPVPAFGARFPDLSVARVDGEGQQTVGVGGAALEVVVADVNGDGRNDFVVALSDGRVALVLNQGIQPVDPTDGSKVEILYSTPRSIIVGGSPVRIALGDLNADGLPDIAVGEKARGVVSILLSTRAFGDVSYRTSQILEVGGAPTDLAIEDVDGDRLRDLVVLTAAGAVEVWPGRGALGKGDGGYVEVLPRLSPRLILFGNLDQDDDGIVDVIVAQHDQANAMQILNGLGFQGQGTGTLSFGRFAHWTEGANEVAMADFNGDGRLDGFGVGSAGSNDPTGTTSFEVLLDTGNAFDHHVYRFPGAPSTRNSGGVRPPRFADLNRDRRSDLVFTTQWGGVGVVLSGSGSGPFDALGTPNPKVIRPFAEEHRSDAIAIKDVDGDDRLDLVSIDTGIGEVQIALGDAHGGFASPIQVPAGISGDPAANNRQAQVFAADIDLDGRIDLLCVGDDPPKMTLCLGTTTGPGTASFEDPIDIPTAAGITDALHMAGLADVDGDGRPDIIAASSSNKLLVLAQEAAGGGAIAFRVLGSQQFSVDLVTMSVVDLDGDAVPDVLIGSNFGLLVLRGSGAVVTDG